MHYRRLSMFKGGVFEHLGFVLKRLSTAVYLRLNMAKLLSTLPQASGRRNADRHD